MGLRKLQHFVTLVQAGSFAKAAEELHLSQPALTRSIQALEAELDSILIDRGYGRTSLTAQGVVVLERARRMLREDREMKHELEMMHDLSRGHVRVGFGSLAASFLLDSVLAAVLARYPAWQIDVEIEDAPTLGERIKAEELDIFIGETKSFEGRHRFSIEALPQIETGFFVGRSHPLASLQSVSIRDLLNFAVAGPHLPIRITEMFRQRVNEQVARSARDLMTVACDQLTSVRALVLKTDVVGLLPTEMMKLDCETSRVTRLSIPTFEHMWSAYGIVTLDGRTLSPAAHRFIALLSEVVACHPATP